MLHTPSQRLALYDLASLRGVGEVLGRMPLAELKGDQCPQFASTCSVPAGL